MWEIQNRQPGHWGSGNHAHSGADYVQPTVGDWGRMRKLSIRMEPKVPPAGHCSSVMDQWWGRKEGSAWSEVQKLSLTVIGDGCLAMEHSHPAKKQKKPPAVSHHKYSESYKWNDRFSGLLERRGWHWGGLWEAGPRRPLQVLIICDSKCP